MQSVHFYQPRIYSAPAVRFQGAAYNTARLSQALTYAAELHATQFRKGTTIPYLSHPMAVAALVAEAGGPEDEIIAALLHDGPEDQGGQKTLDEIRRRFGDNVANIVLECSDTLESPKPAWRPRKDAYLKHLETASPSAVLVSLCDKVHNMGTLLGEHKRIGDEIFKIFAGGKDGTLWYYGELLRIYRQRGLHPQLVQRLGETYQSLRQRC